ncbi:diguanylate cyclase domain protein, partial [Vibrio parahaemolyticus V-223/04]
VLHTQSRLLGLIFD